MIVFDVLLGRRLLLHTKSPVFLKMVAVSVMVMMMIKIVMKVGLVGAEPKRVIAVTVILTLTTLILILMLLVAMSCLTVIENSNQLTLEKQLVLLCSIRGNQ